ncbi:sialate O-acetylesterase [Lutibacter citreus]|uniref:sialate O-acetylesterase n=1 Tax=Lutibacter citreus TaxID=2138210 RepID=UPI000DBE0B4C|nr:sialate O-acetylesterase [Lutibacter citreus]
MLLNVLLINSSFGQLKIPPFFGDNMILQQNEENYIWGWTEKITDVNIHTSWNSKSIVTKSDKNGYWKIAFNVPKADLKEHTIKISSNKSSIILNDIMFGEIWVCSGQSNMEMTLKGNFNEPVTGSNKAIAESSNKFIRQFRLDYNFAKTPIKDCKGNWQKANPNTTPDFSAIGYFFANQIYKGINVPVGIINTTWGGTAIESWMDKGLLTNNFRYVNLNELETQNVNFKSPTVLYNAMINPLVGLKIKGFLWYQGESNVSNYPKNYVDHFPAMIKKWRKLWNQGDFPFYYVQICPFNYSKKDALPIIEAQLKTMELVLNTGMVTTGDIGEQWNIHPKSKKEVGQRLAYWALNKQYNFTKIQYGGPYFKNLKIEENKAIIEFQNAPNGLTPANTPLNEFWIAGADKIFYRANAKVKIQWELPHHLRIPLVEVSHEKVPKPVAIRYGWTNYFEASLFDTGGNPASPFRTDNWNSFIKADNN